METNGDKSGSEGGNGIIYSSHKGKCMRKHLNHGTSGGFRDDLSHNGQRVSISEDRRIQEFRVHYSKGVLKARTAKSVVYGRNDHRYTCAVIQKVLTLQTEEGRRLVLG